MRFFGDVKKAEFISRPNRFTVVCNLNRRLVKAFLPNPGRLWELLLPEAVVYLEKSPVEGRKLIYTAVGVEKNGQIVPLHTHRTNKVARHLIEKGLVPELEEAEIIGREVMRGGSRFDFLLRKDGRKLFLEVKSCTLFSRRVAMFPDAVTSRGKRHIEELSSLSKEGNAGAVLFLVQSPKVEMFLPEYHTDLAFARALYDARKRIEILPIGIGWDEDLSLREGVKLLHVPWGIVRREAEDSGCYLLILRVLEDKILRVGELGSVHFSAGHYIYVGSAKRNLSRRIERHRRLRKRLFWHIDYLRAIAEFQVALPIRTQDDLECEIAQAVKGISEGEIPGFGSSDCSCPSHLFAMEKDPLNSRSFHSFLQYYRMERPVKLI